MPENENETVVRNMLKCVATGDTENVGKYVSENWVNHDPLLPPLSGVEGAKQLAAIWKGFSDMKYSIDDVLSQGDRVAMRFSMTGKHTGTVMGIPATGKTINITATGIFRVVDGKATDNWVNVDGLALMTQLGVVTPPKP